MQRDGGGDDARIGQVHPVGPFGLFAGEARAIEESIPKVKFGAQGLPYRLSPKSWPVPRGLASTAVRLPLPCGARRVDVVRPR